MEETGKHAPYARTLVGILGWLVRLEHEIQLPVNKLRSAVSNWTKYDDLSATLVKLADFDSGV